MVQDKPVLQGSFYADKQYSALSVQGIKRNISVGMFTLTADGEVPTVKLFLFCGADGESCLQDFFSGNIIIL